MTSLFKGLFGKHKKSPANSNDDFEESASQNFITDSREVNRILSDLKKESPLLTIVIDGVEQNKMYSSSILSIQNDTNTLIIDELSPKDGNDLLTNKPFKILGFHNNITLTFTLEKIEKHQSRGIRYFKSAIPKKLYYPQRRTSPRINIKTVHIPFIGILERKGLTMGGHLYDLSIGGACINMTDNRARVRRGDILTGCVINLGDYDMEFDFVVRFIGKATEAMPTTQVGGMFENMTFKSHQKLSEFVSKLELNELRAKKRKAWGH